jgi:hypothetical protein
MGGSLWANPWIRYSDHDMHDNFGGKIPCYNGSPRIRVSPLECVRVSIQAHKIVLQVMIVRSDIERVPCGIGSWFGQSMP